MSFKNLVLSLFLLINLCSYSANLKTGFVEKIIAENLNPTAMDIAPDGRVFIAEKDGKILIIEQDILLQTPFLDIEVDDYNERGVNGLILDPEFEQNGYVYVYYTLKEQSKNVVSRFTANGNTALPNSETILFEMDQVSGSGVHNGGGMIFDNQGYFYIGTGDGGNSNNSQNLTNTLGKIIRINKDGSIPENNPFYNSLEGNNRAIYCYGLRNPYTMAYNSLENLFYVNDVGGAEYEEINEIKPAKNYGWPVIEGFAGNSSVPDRYQDPIFAYDHSKGCAIVGASFYMPDLYQFPEEYHNKYIFADYCQGTLNIFDPNSLSVTDTLATNLNRLIYTTFNTTGDLYYIQREVASGSVGDNTGTENGTLWKIQYTGSGAPYIALDPKDQLVTIEETAYFTIISSGDEPLKYEWYINDKLVQNNNKSSLEINQPSLDLDQAIIYCKVSNSEGEAVSGEAVLSVTDNTRPVPEIISPTPDFLYTNGITLAFSGSAFDQEDGELPAEKFSWKIDFHHDAHTHPAMNEVSGIKSGEFEIPNIGETDTNVWYRIYLTVEDYEGLTKTVYRDVYPEIVKIDVVNETLDNAYIWHDGKKVYLPYTYYSIPGLIRSLEAPEYLNYSDSLFSFQSWDAGENERLIYYETPEQNTIIKLSYSKVGNGLSGNFYPNPFSESLNIVISENHDEEIQLRFYNPMGQIIIDKKEIRKKEVINLYNLDNLPAGKYLMRISSSSLTEMFSVIKMP